MSEVRFLQPLPEKDLIVLDKEELKKYVDADYEFLFGKPNRIVLMYRTVKPHCYVARALGLGLTAYGDTVEEAKENLVRMFKSLVDVYQETTVPAVCEPWHSFVLTRCEPWADTIQEVWIDEENNWRVNHIHLADGKLIEFGHPNSVDALIGCYYGD